jgi:hypothetical protein
VTTPRETKYRQAAFTYLHVAILYEAAVYAAWGRDLLPTRFGPPWMWMLIGAAVAGAVFLGLLRWRNPWFARAIWVVHGMRLPALIDGAFFAGAQARLGSAFYILAIIIVVINLWMLARAAWDL